MKRLFKTTVKIISLLMVSLLLLSVNIRGAFAEPDFDKRIDRDFPPDATVSFVLTKVSQHYSLVNYDCNMSYTCTPSTTKIAGTVTIKADPYATGHLVQKSFNESTPNQSGSIYIGQFTLLASIHTVYISTSNLRVYSPTYGWVYLADITNQSCTLPS